MAIDYRLNVINPLEAAMAGFETGQSLLGRRQEQEQRLGLIAAQQQEAQARADEVRRKMAEAQQMQADIAAFVENPKPTAKDVFALTARYPTLTDPVKQLMSQQSGEKNAAMYEDMNAVYRFLRLNDVPGARTALEQRRQAAVNSGDQAQAGLLQGQIQMLDMDPNAVRSQLALGMAAANPDQFKKQEEAFETYAGSDIKRQREEVAFQKSLLDMDLTRAQIRQVEQTTRKTGLEMGKIVADMAQSANTGGGIVDPEKKFDAEEKIRKEYSAKAAAYNESRNSYSQMLASSASKNKAGDLALITTFRKILDPGSVVRETEFAQAQNIGSLFDSLLSYEQQITGGGLLTDTQRKEITDLAGQFMAAANEYERKRRDSYMSVVDEYGLNPNNVFGLEPVGQIAMPAGATPPPAPTGTPAVPAGRPRILRITPAAAPSGIQGPRE